MDATRMNANSIVTLIKYVDDQREQREPEIRLLFGQLTKTLVQRAFSLPVASWPILENPIDGGLYMFEQNGRIDPAIVASERNGNQEHVFIVHTSIGHRNGAIPPSYCTFRVYAYIGQWDSTYSSWSDGNVTTFAEISEIDFNLSAIIGKFVRNEPRYLSTSMQYVLATGNGIKPECFFDYNFWRGQHLSGTRVTILQKPPSVVPKDQAEPTASKKQKRKSDDEDEAFKAALEVVAKKLRRSDRMALSEEVAEAVKEDFKCVVCLLTMTDPVACLLCNKLVGCRACIERTLRENTRRTNMPCCRGVSAGQSYLLIKGLQALEKLRVWEAITDVMPMLRPAEQAASERRQQSAVDEAEEYKAALAVVARNVCQLYGSALSEEVAEAIKADLRCSICRCIMTSPVACWSCNNLVGCCACIDGTLRENNGRDGMRCCHGRNSWNGQRYIPIKGLGVLEKLRGREAFAGASDKDQPSTSAASRSC